MRIVHTADWHLGKSVGGAPRDGEHAEALAKLRDVLDAERPDVLLIAGDVFDTHSPSPEAERLFYGFLTDIAPLQVQTLIIAGNHDSPRRLAAVQPLLKLASVHVVAQPAGPADGGVVELRSRDGRERLVAACLPYVTPRFVPPSLEAALAADVREAPRRSRRQRADAVDVPLFVPPVPGKSSSRRGRRRAAPPRAEAVEPPEVLPFAARMRALLARLAARFAADSINIVVGHAFIAGAELDGSESVAAVDPDARLSAADLPAGTHYAALGHIHRPQGIAGPVPVRYAGSLLQLGFSEAQQPKSVVVLDAEPGAGVTDLREVPIVAGRRLRDVTASTLAELERLVADGRFGNDWVRVVLRDEPPRPGLAEEVRDLLPDAIKVRVQPSLAPDRAPMPPLAAEPARAERDLFDLYAEYWRLKKTGEMPAAVAAAFREIVGVEERTRESLEAVVPEPAPSSRTPLVVADDDSDDSEMLAAFGDEPEIVRGLFDQLET